MSGYAYVLGECVICRRSFWFNPHIVPSSSLLTGQREPICEACIGAINARKRALGRDEWVIPPGAYEPLPEQEL